MRLTQEGMQLLDGIEYAINDHGIFNSDYSGILKCATNRSRWLQPLRLSWLPPLVYRTKKITLTDLQII